MLRTRNPRPTALQRGYTYRWSKAAKRYLREHPICMIRGPECTLEATCVDHIVPHKKPRPGWYERFWNPEGIRVLERGHPLLERGHPSLPQTGH